MLSRLTSYALKNIASNTFLSISSVLIISLLIFFIHILLLLHNVSFRLIDEVNEKLTISLYLKDSYDKNSIEVIDLQNDIKKSIPDIHIKYKTKAELLEELRMRDPDLVQILERQNPLPETISIKDIPLSEYEKLNSLIENKLFILSETGGLERQDQQHFSSYTRQFERIKKIIGILHMLQGGLYIIILTFLLSIAVIIYSIIGNFIYYYRDEIYITRLVWGSKIFIYGPFALQGAIYVALGFCIATLLYLFFLSNLRYLLDLSEVSQIYTGNFGLILSLEACIFLSIGILSGLVSSRRYIHKPT